MLALSLGTTLFLWRLYDSSLTTQAKKTYQDKTEAIASRIVKRMHENEQVLRGAAGLLNSHPEVTRDEWRRYVSTLGLGEHYPGIQGVGFSKWLKPEEKERHIQQVRSEGFPQYAIHPECPPGAECAAYTSIIYLEPFDWRNQRAFGYDMLSEPIRRMAMEKARDDATTTIAAKIILVQETDKDRQNGMLMVVPVYRLGMRTDTIESRRDALLGYAYSPIRINDFITATFDKMPQDVAFALFASSNQDSDSLLFSSIQSEHIKIPEHYAPSFHSSKTVEAFGRSWLITFATLPAFAVEAHGYLSYSALASGLVVSVLLSMIAGMLRSARDRAFLAARKLAESEEKYRILFRDSPEPYLILTNGVFVDCNRATEVILRGDRAQILGKPPELLSPEFQADGRRSSEVAEERLEEALRTGHKTFEWVHRRLDGEEFFVEVAIALIRLDGMPSLFTAWRDITERKRTEKALEELNRNLEVLTITDSLTGIANRRHFDEVLVQEHARHARSGAELSLILLDVDHFKAFNDTYGHVKGDDCLRQVAQVIADCATRAADLAARYGGEEFACILPETDRSG
ncbi:MAG: CHASE domain-containing protein, partial [Myxococcales bacterium]